MGYFGLFLVQLINFCVCESDHILEVVELVKLVSFGFLTNLFEVTWKLRLCDTC